MTSLNFGAVACKLYFVQLRGICNQGFLLQEKLTQSEGSLEEVKCFLWFATRTIGVSVVLLSSSSVKALCSVINGLKEILEGFHGVITGQYRREHKRALSNCEDFLCSLTMQVKLVPMQLSSHLVELWCFELIVVLFFIFIFQQPMPLPFPTLVLQDFQGSNHRIPG